VLASAFSLERFEPIARRHPEVVEPPRLIEVEQLPSGGSFEGSKSGNLKVVKERCGVLALEGANHSTWRLSRVT